MANRVMAQKLRKHKQWVYRKAPRKYAAERVKVSQGPDVRIGEYFNRVREIGPTDVFVCSCKKTFIKEENIKKHCSLLGYKHKIVERPFVDTKAVPKPEISIDDPVLAKEIKKLFQEKQGRFQKIHEYHQVQIPGVSQYCVQYYFGGGEHFFIQELPTQGVRRISASYSSRDEAVRKLRLYHKLPEFWVDVQVIRT